MDEARRHAPSVPDVQTKTCFVCARPCPIGPRASQHACRGLVGVRPGLSCRAIPELPAGVCMCGATKS